MEKKIAKRLKLSDAQQEHLEKISLSGNEFKTIFPCSGSTLSKLERLELIEHRHFTSIEIINGKFPSSMSSHEWRLTSSGDEILSAIKPK